MDPSIPPYGPPQGERDLASIADITSHAFAMPVADSIAWLQKITALGALPRVQREGGAVTSTLVIIPMGQWLGGRRVAMAGVAGVGVAPASRGLGSGKRLMREGLREMKALGFPLSVLYPATQPIYQRVGYGQAGSRFELRVPVSALVGFQERSLSVRPVEAADVPVLQELYRRQAQARHGWLDRGPYIWHRVANPRGETAHGFLVEGREGVEGYLYLTRRPQPGSLRYELSLTDLVARTPAAGRRLLGFLGDHRSLATDAVWRGGAADPFLHLLQEQTHEVKLLFQWMMRLLDVPVALQSRGYPAGLSGALHLEVEDDLFPENQGRFVLEVAGGEAEVRAGGDGDLKLNARALASLYTGFLSPWALQLAGMLEGREDALRTASALFAGMPPTMPDMF